MLNKKASIVGIAGVDTVEKVLRQGNATHFLSIRDVGRGELNFGSADMIGRLTVRMEDVEDPSKENAPQRAQVEQIFRWHDGLPPGARLVVGCEAGVARSTAVAFSLIAREMLPACGIDNAVNFAFAALLTLRPMASPNILICAHADNICGFGGKLYSRAESYVEKLMFDRHGMALRVLSARSVLEADLSMISGP